MINDLNIFKTLLNIILKVFYKFNTSSRLCNKYSVSSKEGVVHAAILLNY